MRPLDKVEKLRRKKPEMTNDLATMRPVPRIRPVHRLLQPVSLVLAGLGGACADEIAGPALKVTRELLGRIHVKPEFIVNPFPARAQT